MPLNLQASEHKIQQLTHMAANLYTLPFKQQQLKFIHQCFFNPPIPTLIKAINNRQLEGIPFMKADLIRKYLAPSPATSKGQMKLLRTGIRSTRKNQPLETTSEGDMKSTNDVNIPAVSPNVHLIPLETEHFDLCHVFCYAALADKHKGTMYTDATGALPVIT